MPEQTHSKVAIEREAHRVFWEELFSYLPEDFRNRFEVTGKNELSIEVEAFGVPKWVSVGSRARTCMVGDKEISYCGVTAAALYAQELEEKAAKKKEKKEKKTK